MSKFVLAALDTLPQVTCVLSDATPLSKWVMYKLIHHAVSVVLGHMPSGCAFLLCRFIWTVCFYVLQAQMFLFWNDVEPLGSGSFVWWCLAGCCVGVVVSGTCWFAKAAAVEVQAGVIYSVSICVCVCPCARRAYYMFIILYILNIITNTYRNTMDSWHGLPLQDHHLSCYVLGASVVLNTFCSDPDGSGFWSWCRLIWDS